MQNWLNPLDKVRVTRAPTVRSQAASEELIVLLP